MIVDQEELVTFPSPLIHENPEWENFFEFGKPWDGYDTNIWANGNDPAVAPFDQEVNESVFILNA